MTLKDLKSSVYLEVVILNWRVIMNIWIVMVIAFAVVCIVDLVCDAVVSVAGNRQKQPEDEEIIKPELTD